MTERFAAYHFGHAAATSTSVENGASLEAAMDQSVSPAFTSTPLTLPGAAAASRDPGWLSSPGTTTGGRGRQPGSGAVDVVLLRSAPPVAAGDGSVRTARPCVEVGIHSGVGWTSA